MANPSPLPEQPNDEWSPWERQLYSAFGKGPIRRGIRALAMTVYREDGVHLASAMAFDLFLALIPLLALAGWVLSIVLRGDSDMMHRLSVVFDLTPADVRDVVNQHADRLFGGSLAPLALAGGLWLASGAFGTVMSAFQRSLPANERPWWKRKLIALLCVLLSLASLSLGAVVAVWLTGRRAASWLPKLLPADSLILMSGAEYVGVLVSCVTGALMVAGFFRIGISRHVSKRRIWPGTFLTISLGSAASYAFALYARTLARYAFYYGSLAAVAVMLAWLWMCSMALLLGAALNAHLEGGALPGPASARRSQGRESGPASEA